MVALSAGLLASVLLLQPAAAFNWGAAKPFQNPINNNNVCNDQQKGGFNWQGLQPGRFNNFGGFDFSGFDCKDSFSGRNGRRGLQTRNGFQVWWHSFLYVPLILTRSSKKSSRADAPPTRLPPRRFLAVLTRTSPSRRCKSLSSLIPTLTLSTLCLTAVAASRRRNALPAALPFPTSSAVVPRRSRSSVLDPARIVTSAFTRSTLTAMVLLPHHLLLRHQARLPRRLPSLPPSLLLSLLLSLLPSLLPSLRL